MNTHRIQHKINYYYYSPLESCWKMFCVLNDDQHNRTVMTQDIMTNIKQSVIQLALERDRQEMMLVYLEHLCTRQSLENDIESIVVQANKK